jgi:hypothetical protein
MRVEGVQKYRKRNRAVADITKRVQAVKLDREAKRRTGPVVVKRAADMTAAERARYRL